MEDNKEEVIPTEDIIKQLLPDVPPVKNPEGIELDEWVFTNDKKNPGIRQLYRMFYYSVFENKIGLMHAKVKGSDTVVTLIVGVDVDKDGNLVTWPIAKVLTEDEQNNFAAPDGHDGYVE